MDLCKICNNPRTFGYALFCDAANGYICETCEKKLYSQFAKNLRDQFACAALQGLSSTIEFNTVAIGLSNIENAIAEKCYAFADAMLAEREKK